MRQLALVPAVLAAGITCAAPAHALPILHWEGDSPRGGMIVVAGGGHLPVHAEMNTIDGVMHMTAANGCDENWLNTGRDETVINGITNGFVDVRVNSGQGPGCQPTGTYPAQMNIEDNGGGNYTMTVTETPFMAGPDGAATWVLFGHDG